MSRSHSSTDKCRNCKVGRRDLAVMYEFNFNGLPLHLKQNKKNSKSYHNSTNSYF